MGGTSRFPFVYSFISRLVGNHTTATHTTSCGTKERHLRLCLAHRCGWKVVTDTGARINGVIHTPKVPCGASAPVFLPLDLNPACLEASCFRHTAPHPARWGVVPIGSIERLVGQENGIIPYACTCYHNYHRYMGEASSCVRLCFFPVVLVVCQSRHFWRHQVEAVLCVHRKDRSTIILPFFGDCLTCSSAILSGSSGRMQDFLSFLFLPCIAQETLFVLNQVYIYGNGTPLR